MPHVAVVGGYGFIDDVLYIIHSVGITQHVANIAYVDARFLRCLDEEIDAIGGGSPLLLLQRVGTFNALGVIIALPFWSGG
jgi:hypothetical protein